MRVVGLDISKVKHPDTVALLARKLLDMIHKICSVQDLLKNNTYKSLRRFVKKIQVFSNSILSFGILEISKSTISRANARARSASACAFARPSWGVQRSCTRNKGKESVHKSYTEHAYAR